MSTIGTWIINYLPKSTLVPLRFASARVKRKLEPELLYLQNILPRCRVAIDIGANDGNYCYSLAKSAKEIKAFEPQPALCEILRAWNHPKIEVFNMGLSDKNGAMTLHVPKDKSGKGVASLASLRELPNSIEYEVPVRRLDDFNFKDVDFIKIDVEGHEAEVLRGATTTIQKNKPVLLVEIEQRHLNIPIDHLLQEIINMGYAGHFLLEGKMTNVSAFSFEYHQKPYLLNPHSREAMNAYIYNFFFLPRP